SVGTQKRCRCAGERSNGGSEIERVLHVARGVIARHVELFEIVRIVLELRTLNNEEPHPGEDRFDALSEKRQRMAVSQRGLPSGKSQVNGPRRALVGARGSDSLVELRFNLLLEIVGEFAQSRTCLRWCGPQRLEEPGNKPALACKIAIPHRTECRHGR